MAQHRADKLGFASEEALEEHFGRPYCGCYGGSATNPYSLAVVGILHTTLRVALTSISADEKCHWKHAQPAGRQGQKIILDAYGLDVATMDVLHINSAIQWHIVNFRFMHQDPLGSLRLQPHLRQLLVQL